MNKLMIIGNLTRDPELRSTQSGFSICTFTVAVNKRTKNSQGQNEADYFRVSAWRELGENCQKYLAKGRKVAVVGSVSVSTYQGRDGKTYSTLEVQAQDVEFLTPKSEVMTQMADAATGTGGYQQVDSREAEAAFANNGQQVGMDEDDDLPF